MAKRFSLWKRSTNTRIRYLVTNLPVPYPLHYEFKQSHYPTIKIFTSCKFIKHHYFPDFKVTNFHAWIARVQRLSMICFFLVINFLWLKGIWNFHCFVLSYSMFKQNQVASIPLVCVLSAYRVLGTYQTNGQL